MITINLLPESTQRTTSFPIEELYRAPLFQMVVAALVLFAGSLFIPIVLAQRELQRLNTKIEVLQPKKAGIDQLQQFLQHLRAQETAFQGVNKKARLWAKRLNTLSNVTPDGVWFTELDFGELKGLIVQGSVIAEGGDEMSRVGRLVAQLKADPNFASAIKDIQIESIKRIQDKDIEIVEFTLTCPVVPLSDTSKQPPS